MKKLRFSAFRYKKENNSEWKMKKIFYLCESKNTIETKERIGMKRVFSLSILLFTITIAAFGQKLMPEDFFSFGKAKEVDVNKIMRQSACHVPDNRQNVIWRVYKDDQRTAVPEIRHNRRRDRSHYSI